MGERLETAVALDGTVQQRVPKQRMVHSLRSIPQSLALAIPYRDARSLHRPMSDPVPKHNVGCPENLPHSDRPFAEELHLQVAIRPCPRHRVLRSQQLQVDTAHFGERTSGYPKLLRSSPFPTRRSNPTTVYFAGFDVKGQVPAWVIFCLLRSRKMTRRTKLTCVGPQAHSCILHVMTALLGRYGRKLPLMRR